MAEGERGQVILPMQKDRVALLASLGGGVGLVGVGG